MELFLNLAWLVVAGVMVCLWLREAGPERAGRLQQLVVIALLIAILFPVISVSDDLLVMQNASEADNYLRRDHLLPSFTHPAQPMLAILIPVLVAGLGVAFLRFIAPGLLPVQKPQRPEIAGIYNRPPPAA